MLKLTVTDMEGSLSSCTDDVVSLKSNVDKLLAQVVTLDGRCEDLEARFCRNNIRIIGLSEEHGAVDATTISVVLKAALGMGKEPVVDRAHRSLQSKPNPVSALTP